MEGSFARKTRLGHRHYCHISPVNWQIATPGRAANDAPQEVADGTFLACSGRGMTACVLQSISVAFEYAVHFTRDLFAPDNPLLAEVLAAREPGRRHRVFVAIDEGLARRWPRLAADVSAYAAARSASIELVREPVLVAGGEAAKNDHGLVRSLQRALDRHGIDRHSYVLGVGGGAALDMIGYAAATTHRGVRLVRVPTTVLGQADAGVGVKNGVNAFGKKNFLGTFAPPFAVLVDSAFLATLDRRQAVAGMSEAVKVALIRDAAFFRWIERERAALARCDAERVETLVRRCAELHLRHIATSGDPFELRSARPLDFGHWSAHKLEALSGHRLGHGEAVAIGVALDVLYSSLVGLCDAAVVPVVHGVLRDLGLPIWDEALMLRAEDGELAVLRGLDEFREHLGGELTVTLLHDIGTGEEVHRVDRRLLGRAIEQLAGGVAA
jgi:3-dehydroquinate synthase